MYLDNNMQMSMANARSTFDLNDHYYLIIQNTYDTVGKFPCKRDELGRQIKSYTPKGSEGFKIKLFNLTSYTIAESFDSSSVMAIILDRKVESSNRKMSEREYDEASSHMPTRYYDGIQCRSRASNQTVFANEFYTSVSTFFGRQKGYEVSVPEHLESTISAYRFLDTQKQTSSVSPVSNSPNLRRSVTPREIITETPEPMPEEDANSIGNKWQRRNVEIYQFTGIDESNRFILKLQDGSKTIRIFTKIFEQYLEKYSSFDILCSEQLSIQNELDKVEAAFNSGDSNLNLCLSKLTLINDKLLDMKFRLRDWNKFTANIKNVLRSSSPSTDYQCIFSTSDVNGKTYYEFLAIIPTDTLVKAIAVSSSPAPTPTPTGITTPISRPVDSPATIPESPQSFGRTSPASNRTTRSPWGNTTPVQETVESSTPSPTPVGVIRLTARKLPTKIVVDM